MNLNENDDQIPLNMNPEEYTPKQVMSENINKISDSKFKCLGIKKSSSDD